MDKIELIKAEIERRQELDEERFKKGVISLDKFVARGSLLLGLEYFINSLLKGGTENQEKVYQASEELEKAADTYVGFPYELGEDITSTIRRNSFKAGAQWQKEQDIKLIQRTKDSWYKEGFIKGQIEGLSENEKYQQGRFDEREQMIKNSQAAEIGYFRHSGLSILTDKSIERMPFKEGDKVRIIIVKENKK